MRRLPFDKSTKKYLWLVVGLLVGNLIAGSVLAWTLVQRQGQSVSVPLTTVTYYPGRRSMHWPVCQFMGDDAPTDPTVEGCGFFKLSELPIDFPQPTERDHRIFWERVRAPSDFDGMPEAQCQPLSEAQLDRFEQARALALASDEPRNAWRWPDVRYVIEVIGERVNLCLQTGEVGGDIPHGAYAFFSAQVSFSAEALLMDGGALASILVHEATHAVYHAALTIDADTVPEDLALAILHCGDIREVERQANESLAYLNQYLWSGENLLARNNKEADFWELAKDARAGNLHARVSFAQHVMLARFSLEAEELLASFSLSDEERDLSRQLADLACGPFPHRRISGGGIRYVSPTDAEPELLADLVELSDLRIEEMCTLDALFLQSDHPCGTFAFPEDTTTFNRDVLGI